MHEMSLLYFRAKIGGDKKSLMKIIRKVEIKEVIYVTQMPDELEEGKVYISKKYGVSIHNCFCGCGERTVLPLNKRSDVGVLKNHGWNLIEHNDGKISFTPSVGNFQLPCKSHYIITNNIANFV